MLAPEKKHRLISALLRQPVDRRPVWIMRQAGRYLPEYQALRQKAANFMAFCKTPELAARATLQPLARFDLDGAIVFSDILTIPAAMGMSLSFQPRQGPVFANPIRNRHDLVALKQVDVSDALDYVMKTISIVVKTLNGRVPLIGFAGSPWTLACYMIEGQGSKDFPNTRRLLYEAPHLMHQLLRRLTRITIDYLNAQVAAGARIIKVFDSWGGLLTTPAYQEFSLQYLEQIAEGLTRHYGGEQIPLIFFTKGGGQWLELMSQTTCDAVSLDWTVDIASARQRVADQVTLQGNLDPFVLFSSADEIRAAVKELLYAYGSGHGHVINLGHGIHQDTPPESVDVFVTAVHDYSQQLLAHNAVSS